MDFNVVPSIKLISSMVFLRIYNIPVVMALLEEEQGIMARGHKSKI